MAESIHGCIEELEKRLGRDWIADDYVRTMNRVKQVFNSANDNVAMRDQIGGKLVHLLGENWPESSNWGFVGYTLLKYYHLLLRAMQAMELLLQQQEEHHHVVLVHSHAATMIYEEEEISMGDDVEDEDLDADVDDEDVITSRNHDHEEQYLSEETIINHLKKRSVVVNCCNVVGEEHEDQMLICCVCQEDLYQDRNAIISTLDCKHEHHAHCIIQWLRRGKNCCPLCKAVAVAGNP